MTKRSQLNEIAIMIYWWGPCAKKIIFFVFCHYFNENHMKDMKMKKRRLYNLLLKPMAKTSQLNGKFKEDVFRRVLSPKWPFKMAA